MTVSSATGLIGLKVDNISVAYNGVNVVENIHFELQQGQIGCLLGPSGCGKSTILRAIAGFENITEGQISLLGQAMSSATSVLAPEHRKMGMVFQDIALFPHLTIGQNIAFGLQNLSKGQRKARIKHLLNLVDLVDFENRYPDSLSGGQQQRIALIRAIAPKPKLLLMDEPFSGLDAKLREELVPDVRAILIQEEISAVLVTHDQMEAFAMADHIAIIKEGRIHQAASPYEIYHRPSTSFVASFIGNGDFLSSTVVDAYSVKTDLGILTTAIRHGYAANDKVNVLIRPDDVLHDDESSFTAIITSRWFRGSHFLYRVRLDSGKVIYCFAASDHDHQVGQSIGLSVQINHLVLFPLGD